MAHRVVDVVRVGREVVGVEGGSVGAVGAVLTALTGQWRNRGNVDLGDVHLRVVPAGALRLGDALEVGAAVSGAGGACGGAQRRV